MSIQSMGDALRYFQGLQPLLGVTVNPDIDECLLLASNEGRLRFAGALLDAILGELADIPDAVALSGLRAIVDPSATMLSYSLFAADVSSELRMSVLSKMASVFANVFSLRCEPLLAHRANSSISPWNLLCFMWWEVLPRHGIPAVAHLREADNALLELMGRALELQHVACKEAALHGLALWQSAYSDEVHRLLDEHSSAIPAELEEYAAAARSGNLQ